MPTNLWEITMGIGGEICFGLAIGTMLSFAFIATQWAGDMIGHQMGLNISEVLDPQFGAAGSLVGDMYFMLTTVIFLAVGGHHALFRGVHYSFEALPLLSVGVDRSLFDLLVKMFSATTCLAVQLAGPMLVTMLIVDLSLGCISKTMPQLNVMTAGLSLRAVVGMLVLIVGLVLTTRVLQSSVADSMDAVNQQYSALRVR
jgi:flagellar biosynthetic protein FliR